MVTRSGVVEELVSAALDGLESVPDYSKEEFVSACLTLSLRAILATLASSPNKRAEVRAAVGTLLLACADMGRPN